MVNQMKLLKSGFSSPEGGQSQVLYVGENDGAYKISFQRLKLKFFLAYPHLSLPPAVMVLKLSIKSFKLIWIICEFFKFFWMTVKISMIRESQTPNVVNHF